MKKNKKFISFLLLVLSTIFCIGSLNLKPSKNTFAEDGGKKSTGLHQIYSGGDLEKNDIVEFGEYPQAELENADETGLASDVEDPSKFVYEPSTGYYIAQDTFSYSASGSAYTLKKGEKVHVLDYKNDLDAKYPIERYYADVNGNILKRSGSYYVEYQASENNPLRYVNDTGSTQTTEVLNINLSQKRYFRVQPLQWKVTDVITKVATDGKEEKSYQLTCTTVIDAMNFNMHDSNGNMWAGSYIRNWLNAGSNFSDEGWSTSTGKMLGFHDEYRTNEYWGAQGRKNNGIMSSSQYGIQNAEAWPHLGVLYGVNGLDSFGNKYYTHSKMVTINPANYNYWEDYTSEWADYTKSSAVNGNQTGAKDERHNYFHIEDVYYGDWDVEPPQPEISERLETPMIVEESVSIHVGWWWLLPPVRAYYNLEEPYFINHARINDNSVANAGSRNSVYVDVKDFYDYANGESDKRRSFYNMAFNSKEKSALASQDIVSRGYGASQVIGEYVTAGKEYKNWTNTTSKVTLVTAGSKDAITGASDYANANGFVNTFDNVTTGKRSSTGSNFGYVWALNTFEENGKTVELGGGQYYLDNYNTVHNNRDVIKVDFSGNTSASYVMSSKDTTWEDGNGKTHLPSSRYGHPTSVNAMDQSYGVVPQIIVGGLDGDYSVAKDEGTLNAGEKNTVIASSKKGGTQLATGKFAGFSDEYTNFKFGDVTRTYTENEDKTKTATGYTVNYNLNGTLTDNKVLMFVVVNDSRYIQDRRLKDSSKLPFSNNTEFYYTRVTSGSIEITTEKNPNEFYLFVYVASEDQRTIWQIGDGTGDYATLQLRTIQKYVVTASGNHDVTTSGAETLYFFEGMSINLTETDTGTVIKYFNDSETAKKAVYGTEIMSSVMVREDKLEPGASNPVNIADKTKYNATGYFPHESVRDLYVVGSIPVYAFYTRNNAKKMDTKGIYYIVRNGQYHYPGARASATGAVFTAYADQDLEFELHIKYPYISSFLKMKAVLEDEVTDEALLAILNGEGDAVRNVDDDTIESKTISNNKDEYNGEYFSFVSDENGENKKWYKKYYNESSKGTPLEGTTLYVLQKYFKNEESQEAYHSVLVTIDAKEKQDLIAEGYTASEVAGNYIYFSNGINVKEVKYNIKIKKALTGESIDQGNPKNVWFAFNNEDKINLTKYDISLINDLKQVKFTSVESEKGTTSDDGRAINGVVYDSSIWANLGFNTGYYIAPVVQEGSKTKGFNVPAMSFSYAGMVRDKNGFRYADNDARYNYPEGHPYAGEIIRIDRNGSRIDFDEDGNIKRTLIVSKDDNGNTPVSLKKEIGTGIYYYVEKHNNETVGYAMIPTFTLYDGDEKIEIDLRSWVESSQVYTPVEQLNGNTISIRSINESSKTLGDCIELLIHRTGANNEYANVIIPVSRNGEEKRKTASWSDGGTEKFGDFYITENYKFVTYSLGNEGETQVLESLKRTYLSEMAGGLEYSTSREEGPKAGSDFDFEGNFSISSGGKTTSYKYTMTVAGTDDDIKYSPWIEYVQNVYLYDFISAGYQNGSFFKAFKQQNEPENEKDGENEYTLSTGVGHKAGEWSGNRAWFVRKEHGIELITTYNKDNGLPVVNGVDITIGSGIGVTSTGEQCFSLDALNVVINYNTFNNKIDIKYSVDHVLSNILIGFEGVEKYDYKIEFASQPYAETNITDNKDVYVYAKNRLPVEEDVDVYDKIYYDVQYFARNEESGLLDSSKINKPNANEINTLYNISSYIETTYKNGDVQDDVLVYRPFFVKNKDGSYNAIYMYPIDTLLSSWEYEDGFYSLQQNDYNNNIIRAKKFKNKLDDTKYVFLEWPACMSDGMSVYFAKNALQLKGFRLENPDDANLILNSDGKSIYSPKEFRDDLEAVKNGHDYSVYYTAEQILGATYKFKTSKGGIKFIAVYGKSTINVQLYSWYLDNDNNHIEENIAYTLMKGENPNSVISSPEDYVGRYFTKVSEEKYIVNGVLFNTVINGDAKEVLGPGSRIVEYAKGLVEGYAGRDDEANDDVAYKGIYKEFSGGSALSRAIINGVITRVSSSSSSSSSDNSKISDGKTLYTLSTADTVAINGHTRVYPIKTKNSLGEDQIIYIRVDAEPKDEGVELNSNQVFLYEKFDINTSTYQQTDLKLVMLFQADSYNITDNMSNNNKPGIKPGAYVGETLAEREIIDINPKKVLSGRVTGKPLVLKYTLENDYSQNDLSGEGVFVITRTSKDKDGKSTVTKLVYGDGYVVTRGDITSVNERNTITITIAATEITGDIKVELMKDALLKNVYTIKAINPDPDNIDTPKAKLNNISGDEYNIGTFEGTLEYKQNYEIGANVVEFTFKPNKAIDLKTLKVTFKWAYYSTNTGEYWVDSAEIFKSSTGYGEKELDVDDEISKINVSWEYDDGKITFKINNFVRDISLEIDCTEKSELALKKYDIVSNDEDLDNPDLDGKHIDPNTGIDGKEVKNIAKELFNFDIKVLGSKTDDIENYIPYTGTPVMYGDKIRYTVVLQEGYLDSFVAFNVNNDYLIPVNIFNSFFTKSAVAGDNTSMYIFKVDSSGELTYTITNIEEGVWEYSGFTVKYSENIDAHTKTHTFTNKNGWVAQIVQKGANYQIFELTIISQFGTTESVTGGSVTFKSRIVNISETGQEFNKRDLRKFEAQADGGLYNNVNGEWQFGTEKITFDNTSKSNVSYGDYLKMIYKPNLHYTQSLPEFNINGTTYYIPGLGVDYSNIHKSSVVENNANIWYYSTNEDNFSTEYVYLINARVDGDKYTYEYYRQVVIVDSIMYYLNENNKSVTIGDKTYLVDEDKTVIVVDGVAWPIETYMVARITLNAVLYNDFAKEIYKDNGNILIPLETNIKLCNNTSYTFDVLCTGNMTVNDVHSYSLNKYTVAFIRRINDYEDNTIRNGGMVIYAGKVYTDVVTANSTISKDPYSELVDFGMEEGYNVDDDAKNTRYIVEYNGNVESYESKDIKNYNIVGHTIFAADYVENEYNVKFIKPERTGLNNDTQKDTTGNVYSNLNADKVVNKTASIVFPDEVESNEDEIKEKEYKILHSGFYNIDLTRPNFKYQFNVMAGYDRTKPIINVGYQTTTFDIILYDSLKKGSYTSIIDPDTTNEIGKSYNSNRHLIEIRPEYSEDKKFVEYYKYKVHKVEGTYAKNENPELVNFNLTISKNGNYDNYIERAGNITETISYSIELTSIFSGLKNNNTVVFSVNMADAEEKYHLNEYELKAMKMLFREVEAISNKDIIGNLNNLKNSTTDRIWNNTNDTNGVLTGDDSKYYMYEVINNSDVEGSEGTTNWYNVTDEPQPGINYLRTNAYIDLGSYKLKHGSALTRVIANSGIKDLEDKSVYGALTNKLGELASNVRGYDLQENAWTMSNIVGSSDDGDEYIRDVKVDNNGTRNGAIYDDIIIYPNYTVKESELKIASNKLYIDNKSNQITFNDKTDSKKNILLGEIIKFGDIDMRGNSSSYSKLLNFTDSIDIIVDLNAEYSKTDIKASIDADSDVVIETTNKYAENSNTSSGNVGTKRTFTFKVSYFCVSDVFTNGNLILSADNDNMEVSKNSYSVKFYKVTGEMKLDLEEAKELNQYMFTLKDNAYIELGTASVVHGQTLQSVSEFEFPTVQNEIYTQGGYKFAGWYLVSNANGKKEIIKNWFNGSNSTPGTEFIQLDNKNKSDVQIYNDVSAYAIYTRNNYSIKAAYTNMETGSFLVFGSSTNRQEFKPIDDKFQSFTSNENYYTREGIPYYSVINADLLKDRNSAGVPYVNGFKFNCYYYIKYNSLTEAVETLKEFVKTKVEKPGVVGKFYPYGKDPNLIEIKDAATPIDGNMIIIADYNRQEFTVTYHGSDESVFEIETNVPFGTKLTNNETSSMFERKLLEYPDENIPYGYTFKEWKYKSSGVTESADEYTVTGNTDLYVGMVVNEYRIKVNYKDSTIANSIASTFRYQSLDGISMQFLLNVVEGRNKNIPKITVTHKGKYGNIIIQGGVDTYYNVLETKNTTFSLFDIIHDSTDPTNLEFTFIIHSDKIGAVKKGSSDDIIRFESDDEFIVNIEPLINTYTINGCNGTTSFIDKAGTGRKFELNYGPFGTEPNIEPEHVKLVGPDTRVFYVIGEKTEHENTMTINFYISKSYCLRSKFYFTLSDGKETKEYVVKLNEEGEDVWAEGPTGYYLKRLFFENVRGDITLTLDAQTEVYSNNYSVTFKMAFGGGANGWFVRSIFPKARITTEGEVGKAKFVWTTDSTEVPEELKIIEAKYFNNYKLDSRDFPLVTPDAIVSELVWCEKASNTAWYRKRADIDFNWANVTKENFTAFFEEVNENTAYDSNTELFALYFVKTVDVNYSTTDEVKAKFTNNGAKADMHDPLVSDMQDYGYKFKYIIDVAYSNSAPVLTVEMNSNSYDLVIVPYHIYKAMRVGDTVEIKKTDSTSYTVTKTLDGYSYKQRENEIAVNCRDDVYTFNDLNTIVRTNGSEYSISLNKIDSSFSITANDDVYTINIYKVRYKLPDGTVVVEEVEYNKNVVSIPEVSKNFIQRVAYRVKYADGRVEDVNANTLRHINLTADMSVEILLKLNVAVIAGIAGAVALVVVTIVLIALRAKASRERKLKNAKETSEAFARLTQNKTQQNNNNNNNNNDNNKGENGPKI